MTTWTFAGTALTDFGRVTIVNDYLDLPDKRGSNQAIPYHDGAIFAEKYFGERKMSFGIAIQAASAMALESTFDSMRALFGRRTEGTLSSTREDSSVRNALACVYNGLQVSRENATNARAVIEFQLSNPFFRSGTAIADNTTTISAGTVAMNVVNTGTADERDPIITLKGPLNNPVITNSTNGYIFSYAGTIAGTVVVQTVNGEYSALSGTTNVIGNISHSPGAALMVLNAGTNVMSIVNSGGTTGSVKIAFNAPFF